LTGIFGVGRFWLLVEFNEPFLVDILIGSERFHYPLCISYHCMFL